MPDRIVYMKKQIKEVLDYYHSKESRWGYRLVLGGH